MKTKPQFPSQIILETNEPITWAQFKKKTALDFNRKFASQKADLTPDKVEELARICLTDEELDDETLPYVFEVVEYVCQAIERTNQLQKDLDSMTDTNTEETTPETPDNAPESPAVTSEVQTKEDSLNSQEAQIVKAACSTSLETSYSEISQTYEFGEGMLNVRVKEGAIETPETAGQLMGLGVDMGKKGFFLMVEGAQRLVVRGHKLPMEQICASLNLHTSTIYNYLRAIPYFTPEAKRLLSPTTVVEIATAKFDSDEKKNDEIKKELIEEAVKEGWDSPTARSHVKAKKGHDEPIDATLSAKNKPIYLLILPGQEPLLCREEPVWSEGSIIINLKTAEVYKDIDKKLTWCKIAVEPSNEELRK